MVSDLPEPLMMDLHLRLTGQCDFNCTHCYASTRRYQNMELDYGKIREIIKDAKRLGCKLVTLTGGEPFLYPHIIPLIDYIIGEGVKVKIETNGSKIGVLYHNYKERFRHAELMVSYDPPEIRGFENIKNVRKNLELLRNDNIIFNTQSIITKDCVTSLNKLLVDLQSLKPGNARFFLNHDRINKGQNILPMNYTEALLIKKQIETASSNFKVVFPPILGGQNLCYCGWGSTRCEIMPNGDITSCGPLTYLDGNYVAGNVYRDSLEDIWRGSEHFLKIRSVTQHEYDYPCNICPAFNGCRGGCRAISKSCYGTILGTFPYCKEYYESVKTSFIVIKPDAVEYTSEIIKDLEKSGITIVYRKELHISDKQFNILYSELDSNYKNRLKIYVQSGQSVLLIVHSDSNTLGKVVKIIGPKITTIQEWIKVINNYGDTLRVKYSSKFYDAKNLVYSNRSETIPDGDLVIANGFHRPLDPNVVKKVINAFLSSEEKSIVERITNEAL